MFKNILSDAAKEYKVSLTDLQLEQFTIYNKLLLEWNQKINLTAITEPEQVAVKHMIDSISCYKKDVFEVGAHIIDVGTGAGFPGIPLKILQPDLHVTLLDSLNKRVKFLECVGEALALENVTVIHSRAEDGSRNREYRENFDIAVSRAVARLSVLCELCLPFVRVGGYFVALKGAQYKDEIVAADRAIKVLGGKIKEIVPVSLPGIDDVRAVIYIEKTAKTPKIYPRKSGTPEKNPL